MERDQIIEVGINKNECLYVKPQKLKFPYMYREAVEVNWDADNNYLFSPKPRKWSYPDWFVHIVSAASLQSCALYLTKETQWVNITEELKSEILSKYQAINT